MNGKAFVVGLIVALGVVAWQAGNSWAGSPSFHLQATSAQAMESKTAHGSGEAPVRAVLKPFEWLVGKPVEYLVARPIDKLTSKAAKAQRDPVNGGKTYPYWQLMIAR